MSEYKRLTTKYEVGIGLTETSGNLVNDYEKVVNRLAELEDKIERGQLVDIPDITHKFAIVEYSWQKNKPLKVLEYYPCSYNLLSKKIANCYENCDNMNFYVIEKDFLTKEAAEARLKELKKKLQEKNND